jgi:ribosome-binding factor A
LKKALKINNPEINTMADQIKDGRLKDLIHTMASEFIQRESNGTSLITVTDVAVADNGARALIFFTVLPIDKQKAAYDFLKRARTDFRNHVMSKTRMRRIPFFDFEIDTGEKNRQKIDEISRNS